MNKHSRHFVFLAIYYKNHIYIENPDNPILCKTDFSNYEGPGSRKN